MARRPSTARGSRARRPRASLGLSARPAPETPDLRVDDDVAVDHAARAARARAARRSRSSPGSRSGGRPAARARAGRSSTPRPGAVAVPRARDEPGRRAGARRRGRRRRRRAAASNAAASSWSRQKKTTSAPLAAASAFVTNRGQLAVRAAGRARRRAARRASRSRARPPRAPGARARGRASPGRCSRRIRGWRRSTSCAYYARTMKSMQQPHLVLEDGTVFPGIGVGAPGVAAGEACFTTAMAGYEEAVTDPSYVAQVLCFAYPLDRHLRRRRGADGVGARAVRGRRDARRAARVRGLAARARRRRAHRRRHAHARAADPRRRRRCAARSATRRSRSCTRARSPSRRSTAGRSTARVGTEEPYSVGAGPRVVVVDLGSKRSIPHRARRRRASRRTSCRARGTPTRSSRRGPRAVLIANGPGDPAVLVDQVETIRALLGQRAAVRRSASATSCSGSRSGTRPSSCRSATAARTTPSATSPPAACSSPSRTTASPSLADGDVSHVSLNDGTCEGLAGDGFASVQFHPEAAPGPLDALPFFDRARGRVPKRTDLRSILILGSGPIRIGQACEFDYSGAQACRVLRREGYRVVLVNSNPATIMTDPEWADATYLEPLDAGHGRRGDRARAARRDPADARRPDRAQPRASSSRRSASS